LPELFIIDENWNEQLWFSTGGTRAKKYLLSPDGKYYYFKRSQYKEPTNFRPGKDFKYEFWSEIIAYELGKQLGFNVLRYDIAIDGNIMGCISESMIDNESQELVEGIKYIQSFSPEYNPVKKEHKTYYTFSMIENALNQSKNGQFIENILELIIFDAIIGNGDRHQENWAIITTQKLVSDLIEDELKNNTERTNRLYKWAYKQVKRTVEHYKKVGSKIPKSYYIMKKEFAPIYDSGSSLGRELLEDKVNLYLEGTTELEKYIFKGQSEIHWNNKKVSHFSLIEKLLTETKHSNRTKEIIYRVIERFDGPKIEAMIYSIDEKVPVSHKTYKIPDERKKLIFKMITLRLKKLESLLIDERI